ncbi:hypothetical protein [Deinococcus gobiensis]|uniref:Uncharacterized protein n=1 Tax=Deinococcus gobiensis (strain DSM 21396 / JCM 16679 / CGMCC 1.7299 / I-0) TaxID=745776 RepID=H8H316_DEIGI|nr:hypothetical protein [Deinococcus gobiensis]AFD27913.1 hypothetical protein DGo_PC0121 [Deinococcus gobiensis I-0]
MTNLHRILSLLQRLHQVLALFCTPAFHVEQLLTGEDRRTLHLVFCPAEGFSVYATYWPEDEGDPAVDTDTYATPRSLRGALDHFRRMGAGEAAWQRAQACRSGQFLANHSAVLLVATSYGEKARDLHGYSNMQAFLAAFTRLDEQREPGQPRSLIGYSGSHEVAWQAVFDNVPWGPVARRQVHALTGL